MAADVLPRLQLAALHAATSSMLPEPGSGMTGAQRALQLLRQSWVSRPLSSEELQHISNTAALAGHLVPALRLVAADLQHSAVQLQHLYVPAAGPGSAAAAFAGQPAPVSADAGSEYQLQVAQGVPGGWGLCPRMHLTAEEETRMLGSSIQAPAKATQAWRLLPNQFAAVDVRAAGASAGSQAAAAAAEVPPCPVASAYVSQCEQQLQQLVQGAVQHARCSKHNVPPFPLAANSESLPLEQLMLDELRNSWVAHHSSGTPTGVAPNAGKVISTMQVRVRCRSVSCLVLNLVLMCLSAAAG